MNQHLDSQRFLRALGLAAVAAILIASALAAILGCDADGCCEHPTEGPPSVFFPNVERVDIYVAPAELGQGACPCGPNCRCPDKRVCPHLCPAGRPETTGHRPEEKEKADAEQQRQQRATGSAGASIR